VADVPDGALRLRQAFVEMVDDRRAGRRCPRNRSASRDRCRRRDDGQSANPSADANEIEHCFLLLRLFQSGRRVRPSLSSRANRASAAAQPVTVASSLRLSPLLSVQVTPILSPAFAPWTLNCRYGFFEIAGPQCTFRTGLPFSVAITSEMYQAGITLPDASLRWPVSISCAISTRTSAAPSFIVARIFIGSAICVVSGFVGLPDRDTGSTAATADGHLDLFPGHVELAVGLHQRHDVRTLAH